MHRTQQKQQTKSCRSCGEDIIWMYNERDRAVPVDAESVEVGDDRFDKSRHINHHETCKFAVSNRRERD